MGGLDNGTIRRNWVHSSSDLINWTQLADATWTARAHHQGVVFNNKIYIMGGYDGNEKKDVYSWDGSAWQFEGDADWPERRNFCSAVSDGRMFI